MIEAELLSLVSNVGFPIAVSIYFILKTEKVINNNTQALNKVYEVIHLCPKGVK
jgi:hypothetical protein